MLQALMGAVVDLLPLRGSCLLFAVVACNVVPWRDIDAIVLNDEEITQDDGLS